MISYIKRRKDAPRGEPMNWDQIEGKWKQYKGSFKEKWGKLTDSDLDVVAGKRDQLVGKVQERYGIAKEQAQREVDEYVRAMHGEDDATKPASQAQRAGKL
jgi:uncharacterized protein YjbJ (UPF0337 family)